MSFQPSRRKPSTLARLQASGVLLAVICSVAALWIWHDTRPWLAWWVVGLVLTGHAWVLALECAFAAWLNRRDDTLRAGWSEWLHAWWQETRVAPLVFGWRQPFCWRALPDSAPTAPQALAAVVLIHGFVCNRGFWLPWMRALRLRGLPYVSVNLEPVFGSIDEYVPLIEAAVTRAEAIGAGPPSLVCHSMGGLAARAWLASAPGNVARVRRVITIGTPHRGTWLARWSHLDNGRQMRTDGPWLTALALREEAGSTETRWSSFVCWYANTDNIVFPPATATLPGADNRLIRAAAHVDLAFHPTVMAESLAMLASASSSPSVRTIS